VVTRIDPGGPAAKAGVKVGDRIRRVNRVVVNSVEDAQRGIYGAYVGDKLSLGIERGTTSSTSPWCWPKRRRAADDRALRTPGDGADLERRSAASSTGWRWSWR
jgi:hypothetical protein